MNHSINDIESMVPHTGSMVLVDSIVRWDLNDILCKGSCNKLNHPLRRNGTLPSTAAIEYAAQVTAIHGCLLSGDKKSKPGFLAKLTDISLFSDVIEVSESPLNIYADLVSRTEQGCIYRFEVHGAFNPIASGQIMIAFLEQIEQ